MGTEHSKAFSIGGRGTEHKNLATIPMTWCQKLQRRKVDFPNNKSYYIGTGR